MPKQGQLGKSNLKASLEKTINPHRGERRKKMKNILCLLGIHKWKKKQHFYCRDDGGRYFTKMWQYEKTCKRCGKRIMPDWFNKEWRQRNDYKVLLDPYLDLTHEEAKAYKKTMKLLK